MHHSHVILVNNQPGFWIILSCTFQNGPSWDLLDSWFILPWIPYDAIMVGIYPLDSYFSRRFFQAIGVLMLFLEVLIVISSLLKGIKNLGESLKYSWTAGKCFILLVNPYWIVYLILGLIFLACYSLMCHWYGSFPDALPILLIYWSWSLKSLYGFGGFFASRFY